MCALGFKITGLVLCSDRASTFGGRGLRIKTVDIADFSDDTGRVNLTDIGNRCEGVRANLEMVFNGLVQNIDLLFQSTHNRNCDRHGLIHRVVYSDGQPVGNSGCGLNGLCLGYSICKVVARFINEGCQFIAQIQTYKRLCLGKIGYV